MQDIDQAWDDLSSLINSGDEQVSQPLVQLAKSFIPFIKLSRLFFGKLSRERMSRKRGPFCTEMSSYQLDLLETSVQTISGYILFVPHQLEGPDEDGPAATSSPLIYQSFTLYPYSQRSMLVPLKFISKLGSSLGTLCFVKLHKMQSKHTSQKMSELIRTPANDEVGNRQLRYQAKLVVKRFEYLANYDFLDSDSTPTDLSIQIDSIADALMEPDKVWDNITLVLKLQPELEQTLDQTIRAIDEIIPGKLPEPNPRNDQNSREFKCYRLRGLNQMIRRDMKDYGKNFFLSCKQAIEPLQPPLQPPPNDLQMDLQSAWLDLDWHVEQAISWAKASELNIIWDNWEATLSEVGRTVDHLLSLINTKNAEGSQTLVQLAKSFIPIVKLSRLFFVKLSSEGMSRKGGPLCTEMSSYQLNSLETSVRDISRSVVSLWRLLRRSEEDEPDETSQSLIDQVERLLPRFQTCLFSADLYIVPIFHSSIGQDTFPTHIHAVLSRVNLQHALAFHREVGGIVKRQISELVGSVVSRIARGRRDIAIGRRDHVHDIYRFKHETIYGVGNFHKSDRYFLATTKPTEESGGEDFSTSDTQGHKEKESCSETEPIAIEMENTYQTHQDEKSKQEDLSDNTAGDGEKKTKRKKKKKKKKGKGEKMVSRQPQTIVDMSDIGVLPQAVLNDRMSATTQIKPVFQTNGNTQHDENHWMEDTDNDIVEAKYDKLQQAPIRNPLYQGSRVALEVFESSLVAQCYHDIHLNNFYVAGIKAAFQPRETGHDGEIFPNVIKPIWAHAIHTEECARLLRESLQNVGIVPQSQEVSQRMDVRDSTIFEAILQILGTQLQTSNLQNHLPLSELSHTTYNKLHMLWNMSQESFFQIAKILRIKTKLNEYELHRRLSTLNYQIVQKTAVENWNLIKTALGDRNKKRRVNLCDLKSLQIDFQLDREFPSTLDICKILTERPEKLTSNLRKTKINPLSLMITTMGFEEFRRRFNFLVLGAAKPNMNTQTGLSPGVLEDLRAAENLTGSMYGMCAVSFGALA
ncbi:hypothetical protein H4Q26_001609 [Puccinia striiformis f. sp. tritici PST-130]|nr:hypothetical protein H4Q26_001609 [Puccinia striiformis f. sp. tritici PST-130]